MPGRPSLANPELPQGRHTGHQFITELHLLTSPVTLALANENDSRKKQSWNHIASNSSSRGQTRKAELFPWSWLHLGPRPGALLRSLLHPSSVSKESQLLPAVLGSELFMPSLDPFLFDSLSIVGLCADNNWILDGSLKRAHISFVTWGHQNHSVTISHHTCTLHADYEVNST